MDQSNLLLERWQRRIFGVLWLTYSVMYLGRVNMAVALPLIEKQFGWSTAAVGHDQQCILLGLRCRPVDQWYIGDRLSSASLSVLGCWVPLS